MSRSVLITGSSIGIGRETASKFAERGYKVALTYKTNKKDAEKAAKKCKELGAEDVLVLQLDVTNSKEIQSAFKEVKERFGELTVLVNNAGINTYKDFPDFSDEEIETELRTNLEGLIKVTKHFLPITKETVINISSILGFSVDPKLSIYCASKWGIRGFTKAVALDVPSIKFYSVNPRGTATQMNDWVGDPPKKVAEIILSLAEEKYDLESGADVNVEEYL